MSSWTVVEFTDTNSVEAVPTKWIDSNLCFWPPLARHKILNDIKKCISPNIHWPQYGIRIFQDHTYEDYTVARNKAKKAEDTSDLNSEHDTKCKRKIVKRKLFDSSDEDDSEDISHLPPIPHLEFVDVELHTKSKLKKLNGPDNNSDNQVMKCSNVSEKSKIRHCNPDQNKKNFPYAISAPSTSSGAEENPSVQRMEDRSHCCEEFNKKIDLFMGKLSKKIAYLRASILQLREDLQPIMNGAATNETPQIGFLENFNFPIDDEKILIETNEYLQDENNFRQAVQQLSKLGGKDTYDFIKRSLHRTITNALAMQYTYDGTKDKKAFKEFKLSSLISAAALSLGSDHKAVESCIRKWLRRAKERNTTRKSC